MFESFIEDGNTTLNKLVHCLHRSFTVPVDKLSVCFAARFDNDIERCRVLGQLGNGHGIYRLPWHLIEIEAVYEPSSSDPNVHLTNLPANANSTT